MSLYEKYLMSASDARRAADNELTSEQIYKYIGTMIKNASDNGEYSTLLKIHDLPVSVCLDLGKLGYSIRLVQPAPLLGSIRVWRVEW